MYAKRIGLLVALLLGLAPLARPAARAQQDGEAPAPPDSVAQDSVYAAFAEYRTAILDSEPETAFQRVDSATIGYYARVLDLTLHAEEAEVRALPMMDLLMVLAIRHRLPPEQIRGVDAETLFRRGVENGWIGSQSVKGIAITGVSKDGASAEATFEANGAPSPIPFRFHREDGMWKIDLTSILPASGMALAQIAEARGLTEAELAASLLEQVSGEPVGERAWQPVGQP